MQVIKKDGTLEQYDEQKIINACNLSAKRALMSLDSTDYSAICNRVLEIIEEENYYEEEYDEVIIPVLDMHAIVERVFTEYMEETEE